MKAKLRIVISIGLFFAVAGAYMIAQTLKPKFTIKPPPIKISNLGILLQAKMSLVEKHEQYANLATHGRAPKAGTAAHPSVQPRTIGGVTYRLQTVPFAEVPQPNPASIGSPQTETSSDHRRICSAVPSRHLSNINTIYGYGNEPSLVPGMIFTAQSVLDGTYQKVNIPRKPFTLTTTLVDYSKPIGANVPTVPVPAPYNQGSIDTALANLRNGLQLASIEERFYGETFKLHSTASTKLDFKAKANADLGAIAGIPVDASVGTGFSNNSSRDFSNVAAVIRQEFFPVSVSEYPADTIEGTPPADALMLQSVIYGRWAIFKARSKASSDSLAVGVDAAVTALEGGLSASTDFDSLFTNTQDETTVGVTIIGGPPNTGLASLDSFADFKTAVRNLSPTVGGAAGLPITYVFRYLSDDAPALIQGTADYGVIECEPLSHLKVSGIFSPSYVDDFPPDEELYGSIKMTVSGQTKTLWSKTNSTFVKLVTNQSLAYPDGADRNWNINKKIGEEVTFDVKQDDINGGDAKVVFAFRDKIESGPESLGATEEAKKNGFVSYAPGDKSILLRDVLASQSKEKEIVYTLDEVGPGKGQIRVAVRLRFVD